MIALAKHEFPFKSIPPFAEERGTRQREMDLQQIIRNIQMLLPQELQRNIELILAEQELPVMIDMAQLQAALLNLIRNAQEAMLEEGRITISTGSARLYGDSAGKRGRGSPKTWAFVSISDTGSGIDEETRSRIFEPFYTTKETRTRDWASPWPTHHPAAQRDHRYRDQIRTRNHGEGLSPVRRKEARAPQGDTSSPGGNGHRRAAAAAVKNFKEASMFAPKNILVPTDFSEFSDNALEKAYDIAKEYKAKIHLLHVIGVVQTCAVDYCFDQATIDDLDRKAAESSKETMRKQIEKVVRSKDVEITAYVTKGTPYEEILKEQQSRNIDLIVIAVSWQDGDTGGHLIEAWRKRWCGQPRARWSWSRTGKGRQRTRGPGTKPAASPRYRGGYRKAMRSGRHQTGGGLRCCRSVP